MKTDSAIWPDFYLVGGMKCGSTTLYTKLNAYPQIFFPPDMKEPNYFCTVSPLIEEAERCCMGNTERYLELYRHAKGYRMLGDASVTYLWDKDSARRIYEVRPDARIIMILRDPVARAYSHYLMHKRFSFESAPTFFQALQRTSQETTGGMWPGNLYIEFGLYYDQVRRYLETFGKEQVLILLTEDLNKRPKEVLEAVAQHLGIDAIPLPEVEDEEVIAAYAMPRFHRLYHFLRTKAFKNEFRRKYIPLFVRKWLQSSPLLYDTKRPQMDDQSRFFLQRIYDPEITRLEELLGRKLPQLRKNWKSEPAVRQVHQEEMTGQVGGTA
jgi:hypothetical protein